MSEPVLLRSGDHLIVGLHGKYDMTVEDAQELKRQFRERFPTLEVTFIAGVSTMAVYRD